MPVSRNGYGRLTKLAKLAKLAYCFGLHKAVTVKHHEIVLNHDTHLPAPLRIAFAADFHAGPSTPAKLLATACQTLSDLQPDLLLLGGDYVSSRAHQVDPLADWLGRIPAPLGRFAVPGNHEHWAGMRYIVRRLEAAGVQVLINRNVQLSPPYEHIWICGLDDPSTGRPDAGAALRGAHGVRIVLMHSPDGLLAIEKAGFDLALCGHTHGGQIALPGGWPIIVPRGALCRRYAGGYFRINERGTLIVSRGIGYTLIPLRLFADPDVIVCTLKTA